MLKNEREEWELPGDRLEAGEAPEECLVREMLEELGVSVVVGPILDSRVYEVRREARVLIVTYGCSAENLSTSLSTIPAQRRTQGGWSVQP